jgi:hypothetical protein
MLLSQYLGSPVESSSRGKNWRAWVLCVETGHSCLLKLASKLHHTMCFYHFISYQGEAFKNWWKFLMLFYVCVLCHYKSACAVWHQILQVFVKEREKNNGDWIMWFAWWSR